MVTAQHEGLIKTSLYSLHQRLGARIAAFAGWAVPLEYAGTVDEHRAVRRDVGVFDVSHLGKLWIDGDGAEAVVAASFTNDPRDLGDGQSQYTLCCDESGGILDDLIVYRLAADRFLAVPNAANTQTVFDLLRTAGDEHGATISDDSTRLTMLAVQGPKSLDLLDQLFPTVATSVPERGIAQMDLGPSDDGWYCRTGYTGEVGAELILPGLDGPGYFEELLRLGATPCGLGARDTLRLEMGYPLHGNDLTADTNPFEARLGWAVALEARDFRGAEALRRAAATEPSRQLWGIRAVERGIPRAGMAVSDNGERVGEVTSGSYSPILGTGIGLAYLSTPLGPGDRVTVDIRGRSTPFEVVDPPFLDRDTR
ncbi:MAG: glycine cleavage system aminomethyltransferase GcvT [Actinomycetota bacterium]|nr:glycine cleavage system aminomethyltransferase GcvT [Actinomycetota bacterium]